MHLRKWVKRSLLAGFGLLGALLGAWFLLSPGAMPRKEIYRGVYLTVEGVPSPHGDGNIMVLEIHWDTPGVHLHHRSFSFDVNPTLEPVMISEPVYRLCDADWALLRERAEVLVNTTRYDPHDPYRSLPGMPVRSVETVISDGQFSHVHKHSYLLYWDAQMEARLLTEKPPDPTALKRAILGIGLQGIQVWDKEARMGAIGNADEIIPRTFIGVDPKRRILWLIAAEGSSGQYLFDTAIKSGVVHGGVVDSGGGTRLLIGSNADGILPHTGIRQWRPLGGYLTVQAEKLPADQ